MGAHPLRLSASLAQTTHDKAPDPRTSTSPHTSHHTDPIIHTALLLHRLLPADLIPTILDHAQLWSSIVYSAQDARHDVREESAGLLTHVCTIPANTPKGIVRRVTFRIVSKDQGWSDFPADHGTYRNSWTWFEVGVRRDVVGRSDDHGDGEGGGGGHDGLRLEHRAGMYGRFVGGEGDRVVSRRKVVTNVHASRGWKTHVVVWDVESEDGGIMELVRRFQGGDMIEVSVWAKYPGWTNHVGFVSVAIDGIYVRKM